MNGHEPAQALVLSGGGALAAYEVGVLAALFQGACPAEGYRPVDPVILTGTSAGAFNAAALVSFEKLGMPRAVAHLADLWLRLLAERRGGGNGVYRVRLNPLEGLRAAGRRTGLNFPNDLAYLGGSALRHLYTTLRESSFSPLAALEMADISALLDRTPFLDTLTQVLRPDVIRVSTRCLRIPATDWAHGRLRVFENADMTERAAAGVVMASSALPGVFSPVPLDGGVYVDGGVLSNTPLVPAIRAGAEVLHVIYLDPDPSRMPAPSSLGTLGALDRVRALSWAAHINHDIDVAQHVNLSINTHGSGAASTGRATPYRKLRIHRYHPTRDLGGIPAFLDLNPNRLAALMEEGYRDARRHDCARNGCVL